MTRWIAWGAVAAVDFWYRVEAWCWSEYVYAWGRNAVLDRIRLRLDEKMRTR